MTDSNRPNVTAEEKLDRVHRIVNDCRRRRAAGEGVTDDSIIAAHPELMPELGEALHGLRLVEAAQRQIKGAPAIGSIDSRIECPECFHAMDVDDASVSDLTCPSCGSQFKLASDAIAADQDMDPHAVPGERVPTGRPWILDSERPGDSTKKGSLAKANATIPGYRIIEELHRGGQGVVYLAIQESTKQQVALKVMLQGLFASSQRRRRFEREIELVGSLHHPNIAKIFDSGVTGGQLYFAMQYVGGKPLTDHVRDNELSTDKTLRLFQKVCEAVDHAHQRGVIHRDLKPSNILVDSRDQQPYVLDFGLAKIGGVDSDQFSQLSVTGQIVGTPAYMSPEQAAGLNDQIDLRSDVYALGVILYELVTGQLPYKVSGPITVILKTIQETEPTRPRSIRRINDEVEKIALKALSKEKQRRYATAGMLGEDIGRHLSGQPIEAKRDSALYLIRKTLRRYKAAAAVAAVLAVVVTVALFVSLTFWQRAVSDRKVALDAKTKADDTATELRRTLYSYHIDRVAALLESDDTNRELVALKLLGECPEPLRGWEWGWLHSQASGERVKTVFPGQERPWYTPDGRFLVAPGRPPDELAVKMWDVSTGEVVHTFQGNNNYRMQIALSPDGKRIAAFHYDGTLVQWDVASERELWAVPAHMDWPDGLAYSADGRMLASASHDGTVRLSSVETGDEIRRIGPVGYRLRGVAFHPDGQQIVTGATYHYASQRATVWDVNTGERLFDVADRLATSVDYSPDGRYIVLGCGDGSVRICNSGTGTIVRTLTGHSTIVWAVAFSPDGSKVASASFDGTVRLWQADTDQELARAPPSHSGSRIWWLNFHPDSSQIALYHQTNGILIWNAQRSRQDNIVALRGHSSRVQAVAFAPNGRQLASASWDGTVRIWDVETGQELFILRGHRGRVDTVAYSPDGGKIVSGNYDSTGGQVRLWDALTGSVLRSFPVDGDDNSIGFVAFNSEGTTLASGGSHLNVWDADTHRRLIHIDHSEHGAIRGMAYSRDGSRLVTLDGGGQLGVSFLCFWDIRTGKMIRQSSVAADQTGANYVVSSPDEKQIATAGEEGTKLWNAASGEFVGELPQRAKVNSLAFSQDGARLFTASDDGAVRLWSMQTGNELLALRDHSQDRVTPVLAVAISPDGHKVVSGDNDGAILIRDDRPLTPAVSKARQTVEAARQAVDKHAEKSASASTVIESLRADKSLDTEVLRVAIEIATARGDNPEPLIE